MMDSSIMVALSGAAGSVAFFAFLAFCVWIDYRKKQEEREIAHRERMKALELGYPPLDADIERAKAYASAAWAAGLIGLLVPLAVVVLTAGGTFFVVLKHQPGDTIIVPLIVGWSIAAILVLVAVARSLSVIRQLPRPAGETPRLATAPQKPAGVSSAAFQEKRSGLEI